QDVLAAAIRSVTDGLEQPVAPEQLFSAAITAAVHRGGNTAGTALLAGQLIGGLLGNTATGTPSHLDNYLVLEELVDRWVRLTTYGFWVGRVFIRGYRVCCLSPGLVCCGASK